MFEKEDIGEIATNIYETAGLVSALGGALFYSISMMQTRKMGK